MEDEDINSYEKQLIEIMIDESCTFAEAMDIIFDMNGVDKGSVIDTVDFLESQVDSLDNVSYYMKVWTGREKDMMLKLNW